MKCLLVSFAIIAFQGTNAAPLLVFTTGDLVRRLPANPLALSKIGGDAQQNGPANAVSTFMRLFSTYTDLEFRCRAALNNVDGSLAQTGSLKSVAAGNTVGGDSDQTGFVNLALLNTSGGAQVQKGGVNLALLNQAAKGQEQTGLLNVPFLNNAGGVQRANGLTVPFGNTEEDS